MDEIRRLLRKHHLRGHKKDHLADFIVYLKKDGRYYKTGEDTTEQQGFGYKFVFDLITKGYVFVGVYSCFKWDWDQKQYVSEYDIHSTEVSQFNHDNNGRWYKDYIWSGYHEKFEGTFTAESKYGTRNDLKTKILKESNWGRYEELYKNSIPIKEFWACG